MKIVVFEVEEWERDAFSDLQREHEVVFVVETADNVDLASYTDADVISVFIYSSLTDKILEKFTHLSLIATRSTGFDHIDTDWCEKNNVAVANVPTYGDNTVAEHVFGLLLTISHNMTEAIDRTRKGDFSQQGLRGFDLKGKIFGIIGTGSIGLNTASIARGFSMEVLAFDIKPKEEAGRRIGFTYCGMDDLLSQSDIISIHVPYNKHTHHLLGEEEFGKMKNGVVLINTARGAIVNTKALLNALASQKVKAVGLDVLSEEPSIREEAELIRKSFQEGYDLEAILADHILIRLRNVYITPHSAFNTTEAIKRILTTTVDNIKSFISDQKKNLVTAS
ncbi:MAG: hydroxyacid dehydrogenase [Spirochaetia bacterium]